MATATLKLAKPVTPAVESVTLVLSHEEASVLVNLLGATAGSGVYDSIKSMLDAMKSMGYSYTIHGVGDNGHRAHELYLRKSGRIHFHGSAQRDPETGLLLKDAEK
jgi:hypothetical protein